MILPRLVGRKKRKNSGKIERKKTLFAHDKIVYVENSEDFKMLDHNIL